MERPAMKVVVIVNPKSRWGIRAGAAKKLMEKFGSHLEGIHHTEGNGHAESLAQAAAEGGADAVIAVGGDGTVHEVINGLAGTGTALGVIPAGTANDFASHHGITVKTSWTEALSERSLARTDLIKINGVYCLTVGGIGFPVLVIERRQWAEKALSFLPSSLLPGYATYLAATVDAARRWSGEGPKVSVETEGRSFTARPFSLAVCNQPWLGGRFHMAPGALIDDGYMDVCLINDRTGTFGALAVVARVLGGRHIRQPNVSLWRTREITLRCEQPEPFFADGEILSASRKWEVSVDPGALSILLPATGVSRSRTVKEARVSAGGGHVTA
jgi:diacylglycerol kinase (ATP)